MSAHTPGTWLYENNGLETRNIRSEDGGLISQLCHLKGQYGRYGRRADSEVVANAKLIAAAPDLLAALQECVAAYIDVQHVTMTNNDDARAVVIAYERSSQACKLARVAIAKAGAQ